MLAKLRDCKSSLNASQFFLNTVHIIICSIPIIQNCTLPKPLDQGTLAHLDFFQLQVPKLQLASTRENCSTSQVSMVNLFDLGEKKSHDAATTLHCTEHNLCSKELTG